ncbi:MAG: hypothetical protein QM527_09465 [Alphaproteobacteria bacterium]|nr:hypothetical protein [Alphaproteobacteria bacterium]
MKRLAMSGLIDFPIRFCQCSGARNCAGTLSLVVGVLWNWFIIAVAKREATDFALCRKLVWCPSCEGNPARLMLVTEFPLYDTAGETMLLGDAGACPTKVAVEGDAGAVRVWIGGVEGVII